MHFDINLHCENTCFLQNAQTPPRRSQTHQTLPEAPRRSQTLPDAPRHSQTLPDAPRRLQDAPRRFPDAPRRSQTLPDTPRRSQTLPDAPKHCQTPPRRSQDAQQKLKKPYFENIDFASTKCTSTSILNEKSRGFCKAPNNFLGFLHCKWASVCVLSKRNQHFLYTHL